MEGQVPVDGRAVDERTGDEDAVIAPCAARVAEPGWLEDDLPPDPEGDDREWPGDLAEVIAQSDADDAEQAEIRWRLLAAGIETAYAHAPGAPGIPGVQTGPAGGFAQGQPWDIAPPDTVLALRADYASGVTRDFTDVSDDELFGLLGARRRLEARQSWERLAAIAEIIRRRPAPGCKPRGPAMMPRVWSEGTAGELAAQLAVDRRTADHLLGLAWDLQVKIPLTASKLRDGVIDERKAATVSGYCANLSPEEAHQAERILFAHPDVETMTHGMVRDRIARAVIEVNPDAARKRREDAAKECRIEVGGEESGNAMIAGRELPPVSVLKMDQLINARAKVFKRAGVSGDMDTLRVLAFLERFGEANPLGALVGDDPGDSNPGDSNPGGDDPGGSNSGENNSGGVAARILLTAPVATLTEMAGRPGVLRGTGPIDPAHVRDLADAAADSAMTTYDFTLTGPDGRPVAHACGKPAKREKQNKQHRQPGQNLDPDPPRLTLIDRGPPGGFGTWRYTHRDREIIFEFEDLAGPCDHKHRAAGHDPGKHLRHLTVVLNQTCTYPACRRPGLQCDYEHSRPYDEDGITCLCNGAPVCRRDHQDKQRPGWKVEGTGMRGWFRWRTPSGRT